MILSASRRTDIPAFYSQWFLNRIKEQYVLIRNPHNPRQVSRIRLTPDTVDCIVFWSKNPAPMLSRLASLTPYCYYFQFTLNPYGTDIEPNLPSPRERIHTFRELSLRIGRERVIWRYDPILLGGDYTVSWHIQQFRKLASQLAPYTETCIISFLDWYPSISRRLRASGIRDLADGEQTALAEGFALAAHSSGLSLATCSERIDLSSYGIRPACCIDRSLIQRLLGCPLKAAKDKNQRQECGCISSIDLGFYHTCPNGCLYCYANPYGRPKHAADYDPSSPLLCSHLAADDQVYERKTASLKEPQMRLPVI